MSKFDHFNFIGPVYDHIFGRGDGKDVIELADIQQEHKLLDIGGGTGRVTARIRGKTGKFWVADAALKMLREAQLKGVPAINAQAERLPFAESSFNRIIMVDALHHVKDQQKTLDEMWRLITPGGRIVIEEPDIANFWVKLIAVGEKILLMRSHFLNPDRIAAMSQFGEDATIEIRRNGGIAWIIITKKRFKTRED